MDAWEHKILDLEKIQKDDVSKDKKRKWLTATICPNQELYAAITNTRTIEHILKGMNLGTSSPVNSLNWDQFFDVIKSQTITSNAKRSQQLKQRHVNKHERDRHNKNHQNKQNLQKEERSQHLSDNDKRYEYKRSHRTNGGR